MKISNFREYLYNLTGKFNKDEGLLFGDEDREITGIQLSWMGTAEAIEHAGKKGANLILVHESLFYPYKHTERNKDFMTWPVNKKRIRLMSKYEISAIRFHGTLDEICVFDDFAERLGLPEPAVEEGLVKLYDIEPVSIRQLIEKIKNIFPLTHLRVAGDNLDKKVERIGLPWGGLGLFVNVEYQKKLMKYDPDLFIAGESDSYGMHFAKEAGIPMIETSHTVSENIGIKNFTKTLKQEFPKQEIFFYENKTPWQVI